MLAKRIALEEQRLQQHLLLQDDERIVTSFSRQGDDFIIEFCGPKATEFVSQTFKLRFVLPKDYPFGRPNIYWIGSAPDHRFYRRDSNSELEPKRTTNLSHTDFGIYHQWYSPSRSLIDCVERIMYSLTLKGTSDLNDCMSSSP